MNDQELENMLRNEHNTVHAPSHIKRAVQRSIDRLTVFAALLELYGSIPHSIIQSHVPKKHDGTITNT